MPFAARVDPETGILRITLSGSWPTAEELAAFRQRIRLSGRTTEATLVLADLRGLDAQGQPQWEAVRAALRSTPPAGGPRRYAIIAPPPLQMLGQAIEAAAPEHLEFRSFDDEADAVQWLVAERARENW
jgi:stage II sporulation SpoAA-like protein